MSRLTAIAALMLVSLGASSAVAANPYEDLLKHASANTNTIVLIDIKSAYASPMAKKEQWVEKVRQSGHGGLGFFPADSELLAITAEVNLTSMSRDFQIGFVKVKNLPNFRNLAAHEGGGTDEIADKLTVFSPRNVYFTSFTGSTLAAVYPADRQYVSRWLKADKANKLPPLAPYLQTAADNAADNTVTIAVDLEDCVDANVLRFGLSISPVIARTKDVNLQGLSVFMSRAKGLTFAAKVTDRVSGTITVEFKDDARRYKSILKDLFLEVVDAYGVSIAGLDQWQATITEKSITLSGAMSMDDLKRVVSLFSFPQPELEPEAPMGGDDKPTAAATKRYMNGVTTILQGMKNANDSNNYNKTATWHDKTAMQLEQLSRRNVDPLAVDAAYQAARNLRLIAGSLRGVPIDVNAASSKAYMYTQRSPNYGWGPYGGGWWGGYRGLAFAPAELHTNVPQVQGEIAKAVADDQKKRIDIWTQTDQLMSNTRRKLGDKYKTDF